MSAVIEPVKDQRKDPVRAARKAGLHYVEDSAPGYRRQRRGKNFRYLNEHGRVIANERILSRIRSIAIPPAWEEVWICPSANGHIQATGRDARGRKQYRYHTKFREARDRSKYERVFDFAKALPSIRAHVHKRLRERDLSRDKLLATVVRLLDVTHLRIGNEEYTRLNKSFGLTTLRTRHAKVRGAKLELRFRGKGGIDRRVTVVDRRLAKIVKRFQHLPGEHLFTYLDDAGAVHTIDSGDVNEYLRTVSGQDFTAKDFRTWAATVHAAVALAELGLGETVREQKQRLKDAIIATAARLGNTPTICKKSYIHPSVPEAYLCGSVLPSLRDVSARRASTGLRGDEKAVLLFLKKLCAASTTKSGGSSKPVSASERLRKTR